MSNKQNDIIAEDKAEYKTLEEMCERCGEHPATTLSGYGINKEPVCQDCFEAEKEEQEHDEPDWIIANF